MTSKIGNYTDKELFRFVRIKKPRILDIERRVKLSKSLSSIWEKPAKSQIVWAKRFSSSKDAVACLADLQFNYLEHVVFETLPHNYLPSAEDLLDKAAFEQLSLQSNSDIENDLQRCLSTVLAAHFLGLPETVREISQIYAFVEIFPELASRRVKQTYPQATFKKVALKTVVGPKPNDADPPPTQQEKIEAEELESLRESLNQLWEYRNKIVDKSKKNRTDAFTSLSKLVKASRKNREGGSQGSKNIASQPAVVDAGPLLSAARNLVVSTTESHKSVMAHSQRLSEFLVLKPQLAKSMLEEGELEQFKEHRNNAKALLAKHKIPRNFFHQALNATVQKADSIQYKDRYEVEQGDCFAENPKLSFAQTIQILGYADLIKINESFVKYLPSEISYIENILPGEKRKRKLKSTKYFEQLTESISEEVVDKSQESSTTTKSDLASMIQSEFSSNMNSNIDSSVEGSGGGTIGVFEVEGGASAGASVGLGVDVAMGSQSSSKFSQEIVKKAIEKTKSRLIEKRMNRSYSLYETLNSHVIDNTLSTDPTSKTGIYCFLDKQVCLTETVYGKRLFMMANIPLPGKNLLCKHRLKREFALDELGQRPVFDITVDDIQPHNYKNLVSRFKASNIDTPPPAYYDISSVYKTDTSNANVEEQGIKVSKMAETLSPFFEKYKRYLITDTLEVPEGYEIKQVNVTVNHGHNGISIPSHLPLKLGGAALGTSLTMTSALFSGLIGPSIVMPFSAWQFAFSASPLLHYNTDSSNVTVSVGNDSRDSSYFFFEPEYLMGELFNMLGNFTADAPKLLSQIEALATTLRDQLIQKASAIPTDVQKLVSDALTTLTTNIQNTLGTIKIKGNLREGFYATFGDLASSLVDITKLQESMGELFSPLDDFIKAVIALFQEGIMSAMTDFFDTLNTMTENSEELSFAGGRGQVPVSINAVAINPGVTINLVGIAQRTPEALDQWRLDTFEKLYQSYLQLEADFESEQLMVAGKGGLLKNPASLRQEEDLAIKELVMYSLNNLHEYSGSDYTLENMNLFESAIDWKNINYRIYNYGPNLSQLMQEKLGVFSGADKNRVAFLNALWCQVMIPLQPDENLENLMANYFRDGEIDFEGEFDNQDELAALIQNLILERSLVENEPVETPLGKEIIPTEFIILKDELPENSDTLCDQI